MRKLRFFSVVVLVTFGVWAVPLSINVAGQQNNESSQQSANEWFTIPTFQITLQRGELNQHFIDLQTVALTSVPSEESYKGSIPLPPVIPVITPPPKKMMII